jgi:hypothetical protein
MDLTWKAENYEEFQGLTIEQLNKIAGRKKSKYWKGFDHYSKSNKKNEILNRVIHNKKSFLKGKHNSNSIPETFTWAELLTTPRSQVNILK